jgi:hypothetical protein
VVDGYSPASFTTFDPPGSVSIPRYVTGISPGGEVAGNYTDPSSNSHGFIRSPLGTIISFDVPSSSFTGVYGMNGFGSMTGFYNDPYGSHGFVRSPQGVITSFDVPGSNATYANGINDLGAVTGVYYDANHNQFVFVRL